MPSRQRLSRGTRRRAAANSSPGVTRQSATALWSRRVKTPRQGRCSGHLRLVTVRTNGPGNLARRRTPFVLQSVIGPSSCFGRVRNNCPRASVAVRPLDPEAPRNSMGERASYRQAKKDRLPPLLRNDPGPDYLGRRFECGQVESAGSNTFAVSGRDCSPAPSIVQQCPRGSWRRGESRRAG